MSAIVEIMREVGMQFFHVIERKNIRRDEQIYISYVKVMLCGEFCFDLDEWRWNKNGDLVF